MAIPPSKSWCRHIVLAVILPTGLCPSVSVRAQDKPAAAAEDWKVFRGNANRSNQGKGGAPLLEPTWKRDTIREEQTARWAREASLAAEKRQRPVLPGFFPIALAGKVVYCSHYGVHAVEAKGGRLLWESPNVWSLDFIYKSDDPKPALQAPLKAWMERHSDEGTQEIVYDNSLIGTLSSDGRMVYAIEDLVVPPHPLVLKRSLTTGVQPNFRRFSDVVQTNKLMAFDLKSGKLIWEHGGKGAAAAELADSALLGPPLPVDGKLYLLTERQSELCLVCLDRLKEGELPPAPAILWVQGLGRLKNTRLFDVGRQVYAAHLAYAHGILVCTTYDGRIHGVDVQTHRLLWTHTYHDRPALAEPKSEAAIDALVKTWNETLLTGWKTPAPVIHDGKVVFTASDDAGALHCVELRTGAPVWKAKREGDLYLGAVSGNKVLLVGKDRCRALALTDGKQMWTLPTGMPSGQGVASANIYYLPLKTNAGHGPSFQDPQVCAIDIDKGFIVARTRSRDRELPGNLIFYDGMLVSQTVDRIAVFPPLTSVLGRQAGN